MPRTPYARGFSLVELVVTVVIIGLLASIAIPRLSRGAEGAADSALLSDLQTLRRAALVYAAEHLGRYPGPTEPRLVEQLTLYSNKNGATNAARNAAFYYGPYLVKIPACPVGPWQGNSGILIDMTNSPPVPDEAQAKGWVYNPRTGEFLPNINGAAGLVGALAGAMAGAGAK